VPIRRKAPAAKPSRDHTRLAGLAVNPLPRPHFAPCTVSFTDRIEAVRWRRPSKDAGDYLLPGFIDLQVNGAYGIDVMAASASDLLELSHCLAHDGTTAWMPAVITSPLEQIERADAIIREAIAEQARLKRAALSGLRTPVGATILGMHLEGPFISPIRLGVHPPYDLSPADEEFERILHLRSLKLITLAPELDGALEAIPRFIARGVTVSIGHSEATYDETGAAIGAGTRMVTHTFNAMRPLHHREPGPSGAALTHPGVYPSIIADGVHVHPAALALACRARNAFLVSDRAAPAGTDGAATSLFGGLINGASVIDDAVRLPDGTLAGASASILDGLRLLLNHSLIDPAAMPRLTSGAAAELIGLRSRGRIAPRARADLLLLDSDLKLKAVFIGGRELD
jgi:N-acetylglucosamine-6-phosphate deacetylase